MTTTIIQPTDLKENHLEQIIDLIKSGGEIKTSKVKLREYLLRADLIAYTLLDNKVICTATLKNPFNSYKTKIFNNAGTKVDLNFEKELGYIATHPDYEGKGHCSNLLQQFFQNISTNSIYATTRKPAMVHILGKFRFSQTGKIFNHDLKLLTYNGKK